MYKRTCPSCEQQVEYQSKQARDKADRRGTPCRPCADVDRIKRLHKWYRGVRIGWFKKARYNAAARGIEWRLTLRDVADTFEKQEFRCIFTGRDVRFPTVGTYRDGEASIDRIDSDGPYSPDNIQIVSKHVNYMKMRLSNDEFVQLCKEIAENSYEKGC